MNNNQSEIEYALAGTGCRTVAELRMALDILRDTLFVKHNDAWDAHRIAGAVCDRMYAVRNENEQMKFDWRSS